MGTEYSHLNWELQEIVFHENNPITTFIYRKPLISVALVRFNSFIWSSQFWK